MKITFEKYHGTGNDFIMIDQSENVFDLSIDQVKFLCDRHFGIGADGLIMIRKHTSSDFEMVYFNSDGRVGSMCGNGGRCAVAFALSKGLTKSDAVFYAFDGIHTAEVLKKSEDIFVKLKMSDVNEIERSNDYYLNTGSPHYVIFSDNVNELDVYAEGRKIRYNERFKGEGTNVNFVQLNNGSLSVRTYERGVEDETLSCGTGVVASSIAAFAAGKEGISSPVTVHTPGGILKVGFKFSENIFSSITLEGPAVKVFEGSIDL